MKITLSRFSRWFIRESQSLRRESHPLQELFHSRVAIYRPNRFRDRDQAPEPPFASSREGSGFCGHHGLRRIWVFAEDCQQGHLGERP
jgi:hypothetical protein